MNSRRKFLKWLGIGGVVGVTASVSPSNLFNFEKTETGVMISIDMNAYRELMKYPTFDAHDQLSLLIGEEIVKFMSVQASNKNLTQMNVTLKFS